MSNRFSPHVLLLPCTDELMTGLAEIQRTYCLPVQSHLSENRSEIAWVKELCPGTSFYGEAYDQFGLFGGENCPTIMAHCVYSSDAEISLMKKRNVFIAHCPQSNTNLSSGIAPARRYLDEVYFTSDSAPTSQAVIHFPCSAQSQMPFRYQNSAGDLWMTLSNRFLLKKPFIWPRWAAVHFSEKSAHSWKATSLMH